MTTSSVPPSPDSPKVTPSPTASSTSWEFLTGGALLLAFLALGEIIAPYSALPSIPVPGSVVGLRLLWVALRLGLVKTILVAQTSRALLILMPLLFVPAGVGVFADNKLAGTKGLLLGLAIVAAVYLRVSGTTYTVYMEHTRPLTFLLGPAVVALAVPLYDQGALLRKRGGLFAAFSLACAILGAVSGYVTARLLGFDADGQFALMARCAMSPMAIAAADTVHRSIGLAGATAVFCGLVGGGHRAVADGRAAY